MTYPLALLSKILSKSPSTRQQPIEHPIPTLRAQSTYSNSNPNTSSTSSFVFIDNNEGSESLEYRPFLPLVIQHERQRLAAPPPLPTQTRRKTLNEPPSPTSTNSSKSPITPIFASHLFRTDDDNLDEITTSSEVRSISEYSLPTSLTAYLGERRSIHSSWDTKSTGQTSLSNSESDPGQGRLRGMSIRTPLPSYPSPTRPPQSVPPAPTSPPPSWPLPEPPVSVRQKDTFVRSDTTVTSGTTQWTTGIRPDSAVLAIDVNLPSPLAVSSTTLGQSRGRAESASHPVGPQKELATSGSAAVLVSPTVYPHTKSELSTTILCDLEISHATQISTFNPTYTSNSNSTTISTSASSTTSTSTYHECSASTNEEHNPKENNDHNHDIATCTSTRTSPSVSTPTTRQYGVGRQVLRGSGGDFGDLTGNSKWSSKRSSKRSSGMEGNELCLSVPESAPEVEGAEVVKDSLVPVEPDDGVKMDSDLKVNQGRTTPIPTTLRRHDDGDSCVNPSTNTVLTTRGTRREKPRERIDPEWTLFLGVPRNASPPVNSRSTSSLSTYLGVDPNPNHTAMSRLTTTLTSGPLSTPRPPIVHPRLTTERGQNERQDKKQTIPPSSMVKIGNTNDSVLLANAPSDSGTNTKHGATTQDSGKTKTKTKTKPAEDWTLSLPLTTSGAGSVAEESEQRLEVEANQTGLVITVEDVDRRQRSGDDQDEGGEDSGEEDRNSLILRVPRIVRSCSSSPLISTSTNTNINSRTNKSSARWMGTTSTPNLRSRVAGAGVERLSSSTLEQEVMSMLLGNGYDDHDHSEEDELQTKSKQDQDTAIILAKKIATLDEDLTRFNALLKNGSAAMEKATKVTLNANPIVNSTVISQKSPSQTLPIKPVLKHVKSCEPFLESHSSGVHLPTRVPHMGPVMRFPLSTGKGDSSFFDEFGEGGGLQLKPTTANLRSTKSAEWSKGELGDSTLLATTLPLTTTTSLPPAPTSSASQAPPRLLHRNSTSSISPPNLTSSTQTLLLPFTSTPSSLSATITSSLSTHSTKCLSQPAGNSRPMRVEASSGIRREVQKPLRTSSIRAVSMGSLRHSSAPVEPSLCAAISQRDNQHQKQGTPRLRLHTSSLSSSSSSSSQRQISYKRSSTSPLCPPSPIPSECSSSALPTPLASSFPLPPSSLGMPRMSGVAAVQQKLKEFESAREKHVLQQQQPYRSCRPPSSASVASLVSNVSSTATVVPSGDQKLRMRSTQPRIPVQENERYTLEDDEDSMCSSSGTYYTARSSFSSERV